MSNSERDLSSLLGNLKEALKHYDISELNNSLLKMLNKTNSKRDIEVEAVLNYVCGKYDITKRKLLNSRFDRSVAEAKRLTYILLCKTFNIPSRYVALRVFFYKNHRDVSSKITQFKKMNPKFKQDKEFIDMFETAQEEVIKIVANKKIENGE